MSLFPDGSLLGTHLFKTQINKTKPRKMPFYADFTRKVSYYISTRLCFPVFCHITLIITSAGSILVWLNTFQRNSDDAFYRNLEPVFTWPYLMTNDKMCVCLGKVLPFGTESEKLCRIRGRVIRVDLDSALSHYKALLNPKRCTALRPIYTRRYSERDIARYPTSPISDFYFRLRVTPERYRARSLRERFPGGIPLASRALDQSALLFCCCHATAGNGACR